MCVTGAFTATYYESLYTTANTVGDVISRYASSTPDYNSAILAQLAVYVQQHVPSDWVPYSVVGIAVAAAGAILVALGDRKPAIRTE